MSLNRTACSLLASRAAWWGIVVLVLGVRLQLSSAVEVTYNVNTGVLSLADSGSNYNATLSNLAVYLANSGEFVSQTQLTSVSSPPSNPKAWTDKTVFKAQDIELDWNKFGYSNTSGGLDQLNQGNCTIAQLQTGLSASAFGYNLGPGYVNGPNDTTGAVFLGYQAGLGTATVNSSANDIVYIIRSPAGQDNWTGGNGSWATAGNWTDTSGTIHQLPASTGTPCFLSLAQASTVTLNGNQSAGSLWFDSSNACTIAPGTGSNTLTLSNTATIWIDAGLHTISAPLALAGGSLTVDAEPAGNVAPASTGLTVSGQITGSSALVKMGPGILYLSNTSNSYSGNTSITAGTLSAAGGGCLGTSGSVTISNATLDFSASGSFSRAISLNGGGANTIQADTGIMTLSGPIGGSGSLTTAGNGIVAISNSGNTYSGATNISAGTLQLQAVQALNSTSAVTVGSGAVLDLNGLSPLLANIAGGGTVANNKLSTTSTLSAAYTGGAASFAAAIQDGAGHVALAVPGGGLLTLSNTANTYSGGTTIASGGTLGVSADGNLGAGAVSINGGMLQATSGFTSNTGRNFAVGGAASFDVASGQTLSVAGVVSGTGALAKSNSGKLVLLGANTYQGGTTINGGAVSVANDGALGNSSGTVTINNGILEVQGNATSSPSRPIVVASANNSIIQVDSGTFTAAGPISGSGALSIQGSGTLALTNAANSYSGGTFVNGGTLLVSDSTGKVLGNGPNGVRINGGGQLRATAGTISQPVVLNGGNLAMGTNSAVGTLSLTNTLTINGGSLTFKLQNGGIADSIDLSAGTAGVHFGSTTTIATVNLTGVPLPDTNRPYELFTGYYLLGGGTNDYISAAHLPLNCPLGYSGAWGSQANLSGPHGLYADYYVTLTGPTQWQAASGALSNNSSWTSNAPSNPGGVALFGSLGSGTVSLPSGGYSLHGLIFSNTGSSYTLTSAGTANALSLTGVYNAGEYSGTGQVEVVSGSHDILAPVVLAANTSVTMYDPASSLSVAGAVSGTGSLTLAGSGTLILEGDNTYSGGTTVEDGTLYVTQAAALQDGSSLIVGAGGTFLFDPSAAGGTVSGQTADRVAAVPEPGTMVLLLAGVVFVAVGAWRRRAR